MLVRSSNLQNQLGQFEFSWKPLPYPISKEIIKNAYTFLINAFTHYINFDWNFELKLFDIENVNGSQYIAISTVSPTFYWEATFSPKFQKGPTKKSEKKEQ